MGETSAPVRDVRLLIAFAACRQTLFPIPVITLVWRHQFGMSLADVMLLKSIFALAATVCEVPSPAAQTYTATLPSEAALTEHPSGFGSPGFNRTQKRLQP